MPEAVIGTLRWICGVLRKEKIPFQVVGDIAILLEGASPLVSTVELLVSAKSLPRFICMVQDRITEYPWRRRNERWDLVMMVLNNDDVVVSVGVIDGARVRVGTSSEWVDVVIDLEASRVVTLRDVEIPIASHSELTTEMRLPTPGEEFP